MEPQWREQLADEFEKPYFGKLAGFVKQEYAGHQVYPVGSDIFKAFDACPFNETRVVILGQDPYHGPDQAHGLCFSVKDGIRIPPSLVNIFKELKDDIGINIPDSGSLEKWSRRGVLLLNATLTVRARTPGSHQGKGWEEFTDAAISALSNNRENLVFLLWGAYAQRKGSIIDDRKHKVLRAPHPSPFSAHKGFFGCRHFSKTNEYLTGKGLEPISWRLE